MSQPKARIFSRRRIALLIVSLAVLWVGSYLVLRNRDHLRLAINSRLVIPAEASGDSFIVLPQFIESPDKAVWADWIYWPLLRCDEAISGSRISFATRRWEPDVVFLRCGYDRDLADLERQAAESQRNAGRVRRQGPEEIRIPLRAEGAN